MTAMTQSVATRQFSPRSCGGAPLACARGGDGGEADLVDRLRRGDEDAYEILVRQFGGHALAVARRLLRNEDEAHDAVQDAFLQAFRSFARFRADCKLSTWLHRIVVNAALMKLRARRREPEQSIDDLLPQFVEDGHWAHAVPDWREPADVALQRHETRALVRELIDRLPETYRTVLVLRDIEELDTEEAARVLGITPNAVKIRLHRARQALRGLLEPHMAARAE
jgi:RNA polymerase sigma-70 factor (ECF subfamily)